MAGHMTVSKILSEIEQLSYSDRMKLVESIVRSIRLSEDCVPHEATEDNSEAVFGMWRDRDVTLAGIRKRHGANGISRRFLPYYGRTWASPAHVPKAKVQTGGDQEIGMDEILFLIEEDPEGGFTAQATGGTDSIFTEADTMDELKLAIMDALRCHFDEESQIPSFIRLHFVKDETIRYAPASQRL